MNVRVVLSGCDDANYLDLSVTQEELDFLQRLSDLSYVDGGGCSPTLYIDEAVQNEMV